MGCKSLNKELERTTATQLKGIRKRERESVRAVRCGCDSHIDRLCKVHVGCLSEVWTQQDVFNSARAVA